MKTTKYLIQKFFTFPSYCFIAIVCLLESIITRIYLPYLMSMISLNGCQPWILRSFLLSVVYATLAYRAWHYYMKVDTAVKMKKLIIDTAMKHLIKADFSFLKSRSASELITKIGFLEKTHEVLAVICSDFIPYTLVIILALGVLLNQSLSLFLLILFWMMFFVLSLAYMTSSYVQSAAVTFTKIYARNTSHRLDVLRNIFNVKLFSSTARELRFIDFATTNECQAKRKLELVMYKIWTYTWVSYTAIECLIAAILFYNQGTAAEFLFVLGVLEQIATPIAVIMYRWSNMINDLAEISSGLEILNAPSNLTDKTNSLIQPAKYCIECENLSFKYSGTDAYVIQNLSVKINPGSKVAIVGRSGSGKSTFVELLMGLYEIKEGCIKYGGINIKDLNIAQYISVVPQGVSIFLGRSLLDNLVYNNESVDKVYELAEALNIHEKLMKLPNGYNSIMEVNEFSGGQMQRIGILRALIKKAPILIIDEGTSNQDPQNEACINDLINCLDPSQTVIIIAHRVAAIEVAERILVFNNGSIVEDGSPEELLSRNGYYKDFFHNLE